MKKSFLSFAALFSLLLLYGCSPGVLLKKSPSTRDVVLSSFRFQIEHFNQNALYSGDYASLLVSISPRSMFNADLKRIYPLYNKKQNEMIKQEVDSTYNIIRNNLKKYNFNLLPANTLKGEADYDPYGYPVSAKPDNVFKKTDLALEVIIYLDEDFVNKYYAYPSLFEISYTPRITMIMKMVDSSGKTVWSQQSIAYADSYVTIDDRIEGGVRRLTVTRMPELSKIIQKAMDQMLK